MRLTLDAWRSWCGERLLDFARWTTPRARPGGLRLSAAAVHVTVAVGRTPYARPVGDRASASPPPSAWRDQQTLHLVARGTPHLGQVAAAFLGDPETAGSSATFPAFGPRRRRFCMRPKACATRTTGLPPSSRRGRLGVSGSPCSYRRGATFSQYRTPCSRRGVSPRPRGPDRWLDFSGGRPMLMSYDLTTGLTFDAVCMPRLTPAAFMRAGPRGGTSCSLVSPAPRWAYLSFARGRNCRHWWP